MELVSKQFRKQRSVTFGALVSRQFRKQRLARLAVLAASRGPDPSFTAMYLSPATGPLPERKGSQSPGLELFLGNSESNVWHYGLPAAGPIRPSLPWCLSPATGSLDPSGKAVKASGLELVSMQFRKQRLALWAASRGPDPSFTMVFEPCDRVRGPERKGSQSVRFGASFEAVEKATFVW